jgi:hypothetical protein
MASDLIFVLSSLVTEVAARRESQKIALHQRNGLTVRERVEV